MADDEQMRPVLFHLSILSPSLRAEVEAELNVLAGEMVELIDRHGYSITQAATEKGMHHKAARSLLAGRIHLPTRPGSSSSDYRPPLHPTLRVAVAQLYEKDRLDLEEIAAQTQRSVETIRRALRKERVKLRKRGRPPKRGS